MKLASMHLRHRALIRVAAAMTSPSRSLRFTKTTWPNVAQRPVQYRERRLAALSKLPKSISLTFASLYSCGFEISLRRWKLRNSCDDHRIIADQFSFH